MIFQLLILTLLVNNINSQICTLEYDIDYEGNDIKNMQGSVEDCCAMCDELNNCNVYTWSNYNGGTCWLKNSTEGRVEKRGRLSSILSIPTENLPSSGSIDKEDIIDLLNITSSSGSISKDGSGIIITSSSDNSGTDDTVNIDDPIIIKPISNGTVSPIIDNSSFSASSSKDSSKDSSSDKSPSEPTPNNSNKLTYISIYISLILSLSLIL